MPPLMTSHGDVGVERLYLRKGVLVDGEGVPHSSVNSSVLVNKNKKKSTLIPLANSRNMAEGGLSLSLCL